MPSMMHDPLFYVAMLSVFILAVGLTMTVVLVLAARERAGGAPGDDRHLG